MKALLDDFSVTAGGETFVFEFLFQPFEFHAVYAFGANESISHDNAGEFVDSVELFSMFVDGSNSSVQSPQPCEIMARISSSSSPSGSRSSRT